MDGQTIVVPGSANPTLAGALAKVLGCPLAKVEARTFPDGEVYARIATEMRGAHVIIVESTSPNDRLIELLLLQDAAHEAGARHVTSIIPYYGYARQDQVFQPGEPVSSRAVGRAIHATANDVVVVDPHKEAVLRFLGGIGRSVSAVPQLAQELGRWGVDAVLAPDEGALGRAERAAAILGVPYDHLHKTRHSATEVSMQPKELKVAGKKVAILDDMIASGSTMLEAVIQLKEQGAEAVYAACTHGVFTGGATKRLLSEGIDRILCTDTLETEGCDVVSVAPALAAALQVIH